MMEELTRSSASHNLAPSFPPFSALHKYFHLTKKERKEILKISAMESGSANKISKTSVKDGLNLNDQTNSRRRKQAKLFSTLIIFFVLIIAAIISVLTMIKRDYDSELPANNPEKAIKSICSPTPYYETCFRYMSNSLYKNNKLGSSKIISSSQIFSISLHTAIDELQKITHSLKSHDQSTASPCDYLYFNGSVSQLNSYLAVHEGKNSTATMTMRSEMIGWLYTERPKIARCLYSLEYNKGLDTENANNCLIILENMNITSEMLNPSINSVFDVGAFRSSGKSIVALLFSYVAFAETLYIFGVQYIFLLLLICMLIRVW
ncbi:hypothetical protein HAX54_034362 [Datura stramonium]|uniref:Pectinesterase inhibitor domain-containing protein n=1 Tax=Datura stramonium TaxID=4076 RepID=A0ABS8SE42_DATST|nr:hypothetical protein [Datura stramonium]